MTATYESNRDHIDDYYIEVAQCNHVIPHFHQKIELIYVTSGHMNVTINGESKLLCEGQIAIADEYNIHSYSNVDFGCQYNVIIFPYIHTSQYRNIKKNKRLSDNFIIDKNVCKDINDTLEKMFAILKNSKLCELQLQGLTNYILGTIIAHINLVQSSENKDIDLMRKILIYFNEHFKEDLTLDALSKDIGYSKFYFSKLFNRYFSNNFNEHLNIIRCKNALTLIQNDSCPITAAAMQSGFNSLQSFYRNFKDIYKMSPTEYIRYTSVKEPN